MISYHIFFTAKPEADERELLDSAHRFLGELQSQKKLHAYRILRVTNPASFPTLPRFQAIVDYRSQQDLDDSFAFMHQPGKITEGGHGRLMNLVNEFKVSFTADV